MLPQYLPNLCRDGPQVLADDRGFVPNAFQTEEFDQVFGIIADVAPLGRGLPFRDPEETEEFDHVIDPQGPSRLAILADFFGQQAIALVPVFFPVGRLKAPSCPWGAKSSGGAPAFTPGIRKSR